MYGKTPEELYQELIESLPEKKKASKLKKEAKSKQLVEFFRK